MIFFRSIVFNVLFYAMTLVYLILALPTFFMPYWAIVWVATFWGRSTNFLLRTICGLTYDIRGVEKIPKGAIIVAAKHQSAWETFSLLALFDDPVFILKRELQWIPIFGWFTIKGRMVPVDRSKGSQALKALIESARVALAARRQIIIFPEGTRRPAGAEPNYKHGVAHLYAGADVPCVPIALNSGLYWPRRSLLRLPGRILVEVLDPIPPGLDKDVFFKQLQNDIETATARLIDEGRLEIAARP